MSIAILSRPVLVLNSNWQPLEEKDVRRAIEDMSSGGWLVSENGKRVWDYAFHGMDITLDDDGNLIEATPRSLDEWIHLPIREKDASVQTGLRAIRAPTVIITKKYSKPSLREVAFTKKNVKKRDRFQCQYCKNFFPEDELNIDHVIPRHHGGADVFENTVATCYSCNSRKGSKFNSEMGYPDVNPVVPMPRVNSVPVKHPDWKPFIA